MITTVYKQAASSPRCAGRRCLVEAHVSTTLDEPHDGPVPLTRRVRRRTCIINDSLTEVTAGCNLACRTPTGLGGPWRRLPSGRVVQVAPGATAWFDARLSGMTCIEPVRAPFPRGPPATTPLEAGCQIVLGCVRMQRAARARAHELDTGPTRGESERGGAQPASARARGTAGRR